MAFGLCPMLSLAAIEALEAHGTPSQKDIYLSKLVSGEWTGAMVLTEPQAGSDLGALTATATPNGDGTYALHGQKIFITWGDHDATDNIVHMVLARLPDAPAGRQAGSACSWPQIPAERRRLAWVPATLPAGRGRAQAGHPRLAHLRDVL
jgi:alkylation response protein AidB-like acyl-CoA dehydrogenase